MSLRLSDLIILVLLHCTRKDFQRPWLPEIFLKKKLIGTNVFKIEFQQDISSSSSSSFRIVTSTLIGHLRQGKCDQILSLLCLFLSRYKLPYATDLSAL